MGKIRKWKKLILKVTNDTTQNIDQQNDVTEMLGRGNDEGFEISDDVTIEGRSRKVQGTFKSVQRLWNQKVAYFFTN